MQSKYEHNWTHEVYAGVHLAITAECSNSHVNVMNAHGWQDAETVNRFKKQV